MFESRSECCDDLLPTIGVHGRASPLAGPSEPTAVWYSCVPENPQRCLRGLRPTACGWATSDARRRGIDASSDGTTARCQPRDLYAPGERQSERHPQNTHPAMPRSPVRHGRAIPWRRSAPPRATTAIIAVGSVSGCGCRSDQVNLTGGADQPSRTPRRRNKGTRTSPSRVLPPLNGVVFAVQDWPAPFAENVKGVGKYRSAPERVGTRFPPGNFWGCRGGTFEYLNTLVQR